ncbi:MAG: HAMP domain-containing histidine kinase [Nitrospirae bacterium]|nr:HAMP domain-containing histidine kinase [Nitrospirota bacterium]
MKIKTETDKMKTLFPDIGLKAKFLIATSLVIILLGFLTALFVNKVWTHSLKHELTHHGLIITKNLSANSTDFILTQNILKLQNLIDDMMKNEEDISYIYLISSKGMVMAHTFEDGFPAGLKGINAPAPGQAYSLKLLDTEKGYIQEFSVPLFHNLGTAHVGISENRIRKNVSQTMWTIVLITMIFLGIGILLINIIVTSALKPLKMLTAGAEKIGAGDYGHRIEVQSNDETGVLSASFNKMAFELKENIYKLEQDIIERKKTEEKLNELARELQQIIYVTSHDLRAPLVNVEGYHKEIGYSLQELNDLLKETDMPEARKEKIAFLIEKDIPESVKYIDKSVAKMDSLLAGLLRLSRSGKAKLEMDELDMNRLVHDVTSTFEYQFKEKGAGYEASGLPSCTGDLQQMNQAFSNLIGNALKYLDPSRPGMIRVSGHREDGHNIYCVEDNGIGIAPEYLGNIFDIFYQANRRSGGEGLGLSIVKKIVERHGGKVWVESEIGKGSRFYVSLPG